MALIDKASLLMVPSTYEAGKLYNVLPSGNRAPDQTGENSGYDQTRADFDFDRGSNAAATRVNADGLIEKYRENLFTYSNDFSNSSWVKYQGGSVTSGQADKDGGTNAWKLNVVSSQSFSGLYKAISGSSVCTISVYAKAGTLDRLGIVNMSGVDFAVWFDLTNGTIGTQGGSNIDAKIEAVGTDGWYRVSFTQLLTSGDYFQLKPSDGETTPSGADGFIYIMNAQLETGMVATDYLESTSVTGKAGVLIDLPRIDYSSGAGALLLEPQRANLITQSEYFDASQWTHYSSTISSNDSTSPDGFENATRWTSTASGTFLTTSLSISDPCNLSVFVKYVDHPYIQLYSGASGGYYANFDIQNNTIGTSGYNTSNEKIESYGNGWYRISCTFANVSAGSTARIGFAQSLTEGWGGLNTSAVGDVLIYGAQLEAGSYPTSYIPNHGETGGVTRAAVLCYKMGVRDVIGQTDGTLFYDWVMNHESPNTSEDLYTLVLSDGTGNKMIGVNNYNQTIAVFIKDTTTQFFDNSYTSGADGARIKLAIGYANNDIALYINGAQIATDSSATIPTLSQIRLNTFWNGNLADSSSVKQLALFNERLTNEELETLTTL